MPTPLLKVYLGVVRELWLVHSRVKDREIVSSGMEQQMHFFQVVAFRESPRVTVGSDYPADENCVVTCGKLVLYGAFQVGSAFPD